MQKRLGSSHKKRVGPLEKLIRSRKSALSEVSATKSGNDLGSNNKIDLFGPAGPTSSPTSWTLALGTAPQGAYLMGIIDVNFPTVCASRSTYTNWLTVRRFFSYFTHLCYVVSSGYCFVFRFFLSGPSPTRESGVFYLL